MIHIPESVKEVRINTRMRPYGRATIGGPETGLMEINPKRGDVVDTIIHEALHLEDPSMPHPKVYREAARVEGKMSLPEMAELLMEAHMKSLYPTPRREMTYTEASKVREVHIR